MADKPEAISLVVVDADMVCYRAAWATDGKSKQDCVDSINTIMTGIYDNTIEFPTANNFKLFLTGSRNFRKDLDPNYKLNRVNNRKPTHLDLARETLVETYVATITDGYEADDAISMEVEKHRKPEKTVIVSLDKDFKTISCWHYDFVKNTYFWQDSLGALKWFYAQVLTGDNADNIPGIYGIGPKKAQKALTECSSARSMYEVCREMYVAGGLTEERMVLNARLLYLLRKEGELWEPPKG